MNKKSEKQKKTVRKQLTGSHKPVSDLNRLRKFTDNKIRNSLKKDPDAAALLVDWPEDAEVIFAQD